MEKSSTGLEANIAGLLCYVLGWVTGIIFLLIEKDNKFVRFHAWQSIFVFGAYTILALVFGWIPFIGWVMTYILGVLAFILWVFLIYKAYKGEQYKLPWAGDMAAKQVK
jgi:uncharacterized membrane protein